MRSVPIGKNRKGWKERMGKNLPSAVSILPEGTTLTDFHSHILPEMDDGSSSVGESLSLLEKLRESGVGRVIATPHFYARSENPEGFFARRAESLARLREALPPEAPEIVAGAELYYFDGVESTECLPLFRVEGTSLLLLEMPFRRWTDRMVQDVLTINARRGFRVILAHAERYSAFGNAGDVRYLSESGVLIQANASWFEGTFARAAAFRAFEAGHIDVIGSDCHNLTTRAPDLDSAYGQLLRRYGAGTCLEFIGAENSIFEESKLSE